MEFLLDFLHYLYNYYMVCALLSHTHHVTPCDTMWYDAVTSCHVTMSIWHLWYDTFPHSFLCSKSKIKEKKYIDLAVLPSHDISKAGLVQQTPITVHADNNGSIGNSTMDKHH